jgi:hypothetical protein
VRITKIGEDLWNFDGVRGPYREIEQLKPQFEEFRRQFE